MPSLLQTPEIKPGPLGLEARALLSQPVKQLKTFADLKIAMSVLLEQVSNGAG